MNKSMILAAAGFLSMAFAAPIEPGKTQVGMNIGFIADWDGSNAFVDVMIHSREWSNASWTDSVATDDKGWPKGDCSTVLFFKDNPSGTYQVTFKGKADVSFMWNTGTITDVSYNASTNTTTAKANLAEVLGSAGLIFRNTKRTANSATGTGITDVHVYRPGYPADGSVLFTKEWMDFVSHFTVFRFMDWGATNTNPVRTWAQRQNPVHGNKRTVPVDGLKGDRGVAIEYMIAICNEANSDMWINIPVRADSQYVANTMKTILYGSDGVEPYASATANPKFAPLKANLKVYIEHGNEIWNSAYGFFNGTWLTQMYVQEAKNNPKHPVYFDGTTDEWIPYFRYAGFKAAAVSRVTRRTVGDAQMMTRFRPVILGQLSFEQMLAPSLDFLERYYGSASQFFYGGGGSAYYGVKKWSVDPNAYFEDGNYPEADWDKWQEEDAVLLGNYGLKRIAYEGGIVVDDWQGGSTKDQKWAINLDPRMTDLMETVHDRFSRWGGELLVYYTALGDPEFSFSKSYMDPNTSKMLATKEILQKDKAKVDVGCTAPCTIYAAQHNYPLGNGYFWIYKFEKDSLFAGFDPGDWKAYPVTIPRGGRHFIQASVSSGAPSKGRIWVNGVVVDTFEIAGQEIEKLSPVTVNLPTGYSVIRVEGLSGADFGLFQISVERDPTDLSTYVKPHRATPEIGIHRMGRDGRLWRLNGSRVR